MRLTLPLPGRVLSIRGGARVNVVMDTCRAVCDAPVHAKDVTCVPCDGGYAVTAHGRPAHGSTPGWATTPPAKCFPPWAKSPPPQANFPGALRHRRKRNKLRPFRQGKRRAHLQSGRAFLGRKQPLRGT